MNSSTKEYSIGGVRLPNPIVVASCPATEDYERLLQCADAGAGAAILKSCHTISSPPPRDNGYRRFQGSKRGLWGMSTVARELLHPENACSILDAISKRCDFTVIPSVAGFSLDPAEWIDTLRLFESHSPACVQLDFYYINEDLSRPATQHHLRKLILHLRDECRLNLLPKLNQELRPGAAVEVFDNTGIAGWSLLDSVRTHLPMSSSLHKQDFPNFQFAQGLDSASLFGSWQLPLACEYVFRLREESSIPILAGGGVSNATDVVRLLSLGADAVQVATAIIRDGPDWIQRTLAEMDSLIIDERDLETALPVFTKARVGIDRLLCLSCGICANQLMCKAIKMTMDGPHVNPQRCEGCGFCVSLCPAKAMSLSAVTDPKTTTDPTGGIS